MTGKQYLDSIADIRLKPEALEAVLEAFDGAKTWRNAVIKAYALSYARLMRKAFISKNRDAASRTRLLASLNQLTPLKRHNAKSKRSGRRSH